MSQIGKTVFLSIRVTSNSSKVTLKNIAFMSLKFKCPFDCGYETIDYSWLLKHIWDFHSFMPNFNVSCGISSCVSKFTSERTFRRHIKAKHSKFHIEYLTTKHKTSNCFDVEMEDSLISGVSSSNDSDTNSIHNGAIKLEIDFESFAADILIELREKYNISNTALSYVSEKITNLLRLDREDHKKQIERSLKNNHPTLLIDHETSAILNCKSPFQRPFQQFSNVSALNNFISKKKDYVAPKEVILGFNPVTTSKDCLYYVPILQTLERVIYGSREGT